MRAELEPIQGQTTDEGIALVLGTIAAMIAAEATAGQTTVISENGTSDEAAAHISRQRLRRAPLPSRMYLRAIGDGPSAAALAQAALPESHLPNQLRLHLISGHRSAAGPLPLSRRPGHICEVFTRMINRPVESTLVVVGDYHAIASSASGQPDAVLFVERQAAIRTFALLHDLLWLLVDLGMRNDALAGSPPDHLRGVLEQLAHGAKDLSAQRNLGMSGRTYSRRTAELLELLGTSSRFQAGVAAAHRGWV